jgi:hypothetical protein
LRVRVARGVEGAAGVTTGGPAPDVVQRMADFHTAVMP